MPRSDRPVGDGKVLELRKVSQGQDAGRCSQARSGTSGAARDPSSCLLLPPPSPLRSPKLCYAFPRPSPSSARYGSAWNPGGWPQGRPLHRAPGLRLTCPFQELHAEGAGAQRSDGALPAARLPAALEVALQLPT